MKALLPLLLLLATTTAANAQLTGTFNGTATYQPFRLEGAYKSRADTFQYPVSIRAKLSKNGKKLIVTTTRLDTGSTAQFTLPKKSPRLATLTTGEFPIEVLTGPDAGCDVSVRVSFATSGPSRATFVFNRTVDCFDYDRYEATGTSYSLVRVKPRR